MTVSTGYMDARAKKNERLCEDIFAFISKRQPVSLGTISAEFGLTDSTAGKRLQKLKGDDRVALVGRASNAVWCIPGSDQHKAVVDRRLIAASKTKTDRDRYNRKKRCLWADEARPMKQSVVPVSVAGVRVPPNAVAWVFDLGLRNAQKRA